MKLYSDIERAIRIHTSSIQVPDGTSQYEVYQCIRSIMRNNPDIFWFSHQWNYSEDEHAIKFHYTIDKERCITAQEQIEDVVQQDFQIKAVLELSPLKQAMYVYKWLGQYCKYNVFSAFNQTIYSVFVCRNSVCTGIAKAAQYLFLRLGIESKLVFTHV